ncbi:hypothetical protein QJS10_CPB15g01309 [Acorus calamus]|uniref:Uncharacterized protein n=1 Tax=Acorus calamus TaxID=4465 RepID=A0AAV9D598_ACOCL|nr:hypothetical protein QJS10_CPB15g01309 [Acorus calamus]
MGTKVESKNYLPGYYTMRDFGADANSRSWSFYYNDLRSMQHYNGFASTSVDGYPEDDKELLKQTMLKHETIFRNQVYELHRLYRKQKDLMDELRNKDIYRYSVPGETSFTSQMQSDGNGNIWNIHKLPVVSTSCSQPSVSGNNHFQNSLNILEGSGMQMGPFPTINGGNLKECELLDTRAKKIPRTMIDLHLPADKYVDGEDQEWVKGGNVAQSSSVMGVSFDINHAAEPESDVKLTLGTGGSPSCQEGGSKSYPPLQNGSSTHSLADLNEPVKGNSISSPKNFYEDDLRNEKASSNSLRLEKDRSGWECSSFGSETGRIGSNVHPFGLTSNNNERLTATYETIKAEGKKAHIHQPLILPGHGKQETWFKEKSTSCMDISGGCSSLAHSTCTGSMTSHVHPFSVVSHSDNGNAASPFLSPWRKPINSDGQRPMAVQALPCFDSSAILNPRSRNSTSSIQSPGISGEKWNNRKGSGSYPLIGNQISYYNGLNANYRSESSAAPHLHFHTINTDKQHPPNGAILSDKSFQVNGQEKYFNGLNCNGVKSTKEINLNLEAPNRLRDGFVPRRHTVIIDLEEDRKHDKSSEDISWLKTKPSENGLLNTRRGFPSVDFNFLPGNSELFSNRKSLASGSERKTEEEKCLSRDIQLNFLSTLPSRDTEAQRLDSSESRSVKKILGFPLLEKPQQHSISSSYISRPEKSETDGMHDKIREGLSLGNSLNGVRLLDLEKPPNVEDNIEEKGADNNLVGLRGHINLNSTITCLEESVSLEISSKDNVRVCKRIGPDIDLEAPIIVQAENFALSGDRLNSNKPETAVQSLTQCEAEGSREPPIHLSQQEVEDPDELQARVAAQCIVAMSSNTCDRSCDTMRPPSPTSLNNSLLLLADVVSSKVGILSSDDGDGYDSYEAMTLKLTETNVDENHRSSVSLWENQKEEETGFAPPSLTRPRRGQARRRRQRKDFQKDILPGLTSLARHEVTEDIQAFGEIMRAAGCAWQMRSTRRNTTRGRRRTTKGTVTIVEDDDPMVTVQSTQPANTNEVEVEGMSIKGWGRTRRCRRQRCPQEMGNK